MNHKRTYKIQQGVYGYTFISMMKAMIFIMLEN